MAVSAYETTEELATPSRRIASIRAELLATRYSICLERPRLFRRFLRSPEGRAARREHHLVRRAEFLAHLMSNRRPRVYPDELIIGNMTSKRIASHYYFEGGSVNMLEDVLRLQKKATAFEMPAAERVSFVVVGLRNLFQSIAARALLRPGRIGHFLDFFRAKRYFITEEAGVGHQCGDYGMVVHEGLKAADLEAEARLASRALADGTPLDEDQVAFYRSIRITIEGIRRMAANLADEAEREAGGPGVGEARRRDSWPPPTPAGGYPTSRRATSARRFSRYGWCTSRFCWRTSSRACRSGGSTRYCSRSISRTSSPER